jgi:hypothetical protein
MLHSSDEGFLQHLCLGFGLFFLDLWALQLVIEPVGNLCSSGNHPCGEFAAHCAALRTPEVACWWKEWVFQFRLTEGLSVELTCPRMNQLSAGDGSSSFRGNASLLWHCLKLHNGLFIFIQMMPVWETHRMRMDDTTEKKLIACTNRRVTETTEAHGQIKQEG